MSNDAPKQHGAASPPEKGAYPRLFPHLPAWQPPLLPGESLEQGLARYAEAMLEAPRIGHQHEGPLVPVSGGESLGYQASQENLHELDYALASEVPAGYTYFGQFLGHDLTFDPASHGFALGEAHGLTNWRTPRLNLEGLYGRGPTGNPYFFSGNRPQQEHFLLSRRAMTEAHCEDHWLLDLPRNVEGRAIIADPRNDDHAIIAQLHLVFMLVHNRLVDLAAELPATTGESPFARARRTLTWLFQYLVWHDYLALLTDAGVHEQALRRDADGTWEAGFNGLYDGHAGLPREFSGAAFRFGHSLVRTGYQTNDLASGKTRFHPLFSNTLDEQEEAAARPKPLSGGRPLVAETCLQWDWFFDLGHVVEEFPQRARKLNTTLSYALHWLPEAEGWRQVLAFRNLQTGIRLGLPAGSAVARELGFTPLALKVEEPDALWYYLLKEADVEGGGNRLGRVGSTLLCATFAGLLLADPESCFVRAPDWTPDQDPLLKLCRERSPQPNGLPFTSISRVADLIKLSGLDYLHIGQRKVADRVISEPASAEPASPHNSPSSVARAFQGAS